MCDHEKTHGTALAELTPGRQSPKPSSMPTPADWIAFRVLAPPALAEAVANLLLEEGSPGILNEEEALVASLPAGAAARVRAALERYLASLAVLAPEARSVRIETAPIPPLDWPAVYREHHRPTAVGRRLLVAPPWDVPSDRTREILIIEPGMAFGTGQHATTRACLEAIETAVEGGQVRSALDVGTGSGILALALARLGVERVVALDLDRAVLPLARATLARNGVTHVVLLAGSPAAVRARFDLVVANLLADAIVGEAAALARTVAPGGRLVLSGLLDAHTAAVRAAYPGWTVVETRAEEVWRTLTLERDA
jgi:ribosomal protein L11 methyltransferase